MKLRPKPRFQRIRITKQHALVLFFALIALVVMSLAAVALVRSVDTSTIIAGNLAFKQAATTAGDAGIEAAINWLASTEQANIAQNAMTDTTHPFNVTNAANGYYSSANPALSLTDGTGITWSDADSVLVLPSPNSSGNTIRYVIQRMCRTANVAIRDAGCLFSSALQDKEMKDVLLPQDICSGEGCPAAGQSPQLRITVQTTGPRNTVSYLQAFVY